MSSKSIAPIKVEGKIFIDNEDLSLGSGVYCATTCGRGCTYSEYQAALEGARSLQLELGDGWDVEVWDNLGWKFQASNGAASIYPHSRHPVSQWGCIINIPNLSGVTATGNSPREAGQNAARIVAQSIKEMLDSFNKTDTNLFGSIEVDHK